MVIRVQNIEIMKKSYKAPEVLVVEMDADEFCQLASVSIPLSMNTEEEEEGDDCGLAPTYRTNLWN